MGQLIDKIFGKHKQNDTNEETQQTTEDARPKTLGRNPQKVIKSLAANDDNAKAIALKILGDQSMMEQEVEKAMEYYRKAILKQPAFADAWNNLGGAYGAAGQHEEALLAYEAALKIDPTYGQAILGKAIALKHLEKFEEALKTIDYLLSLYDVEKVHFLRKNIQEAMSAEPDDLNKRDADYLNMMVQAAHHVKLLKEPTCPHVPEVWMMYDDIFKPVYQRLYEYYQSHDNFLQMMDHGLSFFLFLAGASAAAHWHNDWNSLKSKGIVKTLTEERGIDEMDEYCADYTGIGFNTPLCKSMYNSVSSLADFGDKYYHLDEGTDLTQLLWHKGRCMFTLGMATQMQRMGYK